jgi:hypothetical protein
MITVLIYRFVLKTKFQLLVADSSSENIARLTLTQAKTIVKLAKIYTKVYAEINSPA